MKINSNAWHYRVMEWAYGKDYFWFSSMTRKRVNLCPYVDRLIIALILSPLICIWKLLSDLGKFAYLMILVGFFLGVLYDISGLGLWGFPLSEGIVWGVIGLIVGVHKLYEWWQDTHPWKPKPQKEKKPKKQKEPKIKKVKERKPSLIGEWLRAKHRKICPYLEFEESATK